MKYAYYFLIMFIFLICNSSQADANSDLEKTLIETINQKTNIGISVFMNGQEIISINENQKFPLMSVVKFHQALAICYYLQNNIKLDSKIYIGKDELYPNTYSPLRDKHPHGNIYLSISELLKYMLQQSDNNACDILFKKILPVAETDQYIRSLGINIFNISRTEKEMHDNTDFCYDNWTSPVAASRLMDLFINNGILNYYYKSYIENMMIECKTGLNRFPKYISDKDIVIGHKTGTGDRNKNGKIIGINDTGFFVLPNGEKYVLSVFIKDADDTLENNEDSIARISQVVYDYMATKISPVCN